MKLLALDTLQLFYIFYYIIIYPIPVKGMVTLLGIFPMTDFIVYFKFKNKLPICLCDEGCTPLAYPLYTKGYPFLETKK